MNTCVSPLVAMKRTHAHKLSGPLIKLLPAEQTEHNNHGFIFYRICRVSTTVRAVSQSVSLLSVHVHMCAIAERPSYQQLFQLCIFQDVMAID